MLQKDVHYENKWINAIVETFIISLAFFNKTVKNIISDDILHETVLFDDIDPPWINKDVKR